MPNNYSSKDRKKTPAASYGQRERKGFAPAGGRKNGDNPRERSSFRPAAARKTEDGLRRMEKRNGTAAGRTADTVIMNTGRRRVPAANGFLLLNPVRSRIPIRKSIS